MPSFLSGRYSAVKVRKKLYVTVDWDRLAQWIDRYGYKIAECEDDELATADAVKRLRAWERRDHDAAARP